MNPFDQFDSEPAAAQPAANPFDQFDEKPKKNSIARGIADLGIGFVSGAAGATKAIADAAGAGNAVSNVADDINKEVTSYLSDSAKADQQKQAEIMKSAEGGSTWDGIKAGAKAFGVAPAQTAVAGLGSVVPVVAGSALTALTGGSAPVVLATGAGLGLAMGAGTVKGAIYDEVKQRSLDAGMGEAEAIAAATKAQEYGGDNAGNIALGAGLGVADAATGVTKAASNIVRNAIVKPAATEAAKAATRGIVGRTAAGMAGEIPLEAAQGGQEKYAANVAAQRAGYDVDSWSGVASQATLEALASAGPGAAFGAFSGSKYAESKRAPAEDPKAEEQPAIAGLLPSPTYTGTPGDQLVSNDAERQAAIDAADANAAALYAAREAFEQQLRKSVTVINEPAPLQQRIDDMLAVDTRTMSKAERASYEKDLAAAFGEQVGIRHDANQNEIPFTMGEYLDAQVAAENAVRARPLKQNAAQQADSRLQQLAEEEVTQQADVAQPASGIAAVPSIPVNGPLSKAANEAIQSGAAVIAPAVQPAAPVSAAQAPSAGPLAKAASEAAPNIPATVAPAAPNIQDQAPNIEQAKAATSAIDLTGRNEMQLNYLAKNGKTGYKEAAISELQRRGVSAAPSAIPNGDGVTNAPPAIRSDSSLNKTASWVIREKATGNVVMETFDKAKVDALNTEKYEAVPVQEYLGSINVKPADQNPIKSDEAGAATVQAEPVAQDQNQIKNQKPATRQNKGQAGRDDLVGAILRITGGKGIASKMSPTIIGDTANNATKVRGLFTNDGTFDLDDTAELLRTEEGFDVRDGNHLSELIREQASGERIYSMERTEREATDNAEKQHRDEVRKQAKKLGVKTVARKFSAIEEEVFRRMEQRHNEAVAKLDARAKYRFDAMLRHAVELADYDEVDAIIADAQSRFTGREFYSQATKQLRGYIDDLTIERQAQEQTNAIEEQQGTSAEPDWLKDDGFGTEGSGIGGTAIAAPEEARSESGQQGRAETGLTLEGQTNEQAAEQFAQQQAAKAKEAADKKSADEKAKADSEANDFRLAGSDRAADVAVAGGQVGLFGANGQSTKDAAQQSQPKTDTTQKPGQDKENQSASEMDALKAEMGQAIGELASILGAKLNLTPEEESKIIPVMSKIFRIAAKMGYIKFKDAARYVLEQIRKMAGDDVADKISIDNLQAGYINIAKEIGGDKREAMSYDSIEDLEKANVIDERSGTDLERDSGNAGSENGMGQEGVRAGRNGDGRAGRQGVEGAAEDGGQQSGVSRGQDEAVAAGERGNIEIYTGAPELSPGSAGNSVDFGSRDSGIDGLPVEPDAAKATQGSATSPVSLGAKQAKQREADKAPHKPGIDAIRQALPILTENQQDDVAKTEERFAVPDGYGMLFTNGTGTGKTFTGLGVIKRFANAGKKNILVVAPNDKIIEDWQDSGKLLGLDLSRLEDTNDAGSGIVITTYANMGQNNELASRSWDLIVHDEAHYLAMDKDGTNTNALKNLRALSMHPDGAYQRHAMINAEGIQRLAELDADAKMQRMSDDQRMWTLAEKTQAEADKLRTELKEKQDAIKEEVEASQGADRTRALFLSATPFAYEKTIDWANGYIFDYNEGRGDESKEFRGYNTGSNRDQFFMQHFGYRMRYGKLTQPDAKVDSGLMQRQFNSWLKKKGSLSGRMLDVSADYDRRFILVDSAIGSRIDEALQWFEVKRKAQNQGTGDAGERIGAIMAKADPYAVALGAVRDYIGEKFDYLSRRYLLESIKAREVVPHVREHLALGRKVVVFHDYKKGGGFNPFILEERTVRDQESDDGLVSAAEWNKVVREFNGEFRDIINSDLFRQSSPIEMFKDEFPGVLLFNGDVPAKTRRENVAKFQDDASGPQVILVQSAAGKEGISLHDTTGKHQRVLFNLGQPTQPTTAIQQEGRIYRTGQVTDAIFRYLNTGTNWEKWAFATTIAQRASAAENLGMGEMARALKDAFITGFEESGDYRAGMENEGKGGKERDKAANDALTEYDRARAFYFGTQKKTSKTKAQEGADYFATPEPVGLKMVEWADIRPGEKVLEPSAGHGAIARWIPDSAEKTAIEPSMALRPRLAMVFDGQIIDSDFESLNVVNKFDAIVMNPPFGSGGKLAAEHLYKASRHLNDGGRIVALLPTGPAADKQFEKYVYGEGSFKAKPVAAEFGSFGAVYKGDTASVSGNGTYDPAFTGEVTSASQGRIYVRREGSQTSSSFYPDRIVSIEKTGERVVNRPYMSDMYLVSDIKMPAVTFERAGTKVMTRIVILEKSSDPKAIDTRGVYNRDFTGAEDINDLFDQMENMALPNRAKAYEQETEQAAPVDRSQKAKPAPAKVGDVVTVNGNEYAIEIYTTNDGKEKRGIWIEEKEAKEINPRAFKSSKMRGTPAEGKFFVDEYWLNKAKDKAGPGNIAATGTISVADKAIYAMATEGKSAAAILRFIASASRSPFNRQLAKLLMKTGIAPSIEAGDSKGWKFNAGEGNRYAAAYNPKTDAVALFRPAAAERNVLHEMVHAATLKALAKRGMASGQMAVLFAHVKKTGKLKGMYGMSDIDEFVAEAFTNPKFQEALKKIDAPMSSRTLSSAWQWFIRTVRGILGLSVDQENALSQALDIGLAVMRDDMALRKEQSPAADVPFAEISGKEIDKALGRTIQEKATNWMRINLQGKSFKNEMTGWDISVGRKGINKAMSHGGKDAHARSVAAIPELLKNAVLVATEPNRNERQSIDIKSVHHFYAPLSIGGKEYVARMVVKEARNGQFFYDYDTSDAINPAESMFASELLPKEESASSPSIPKEWGAASSAGLSMSMAKLMSYVKAEHGGTDPKFIRYNIADEGAWSVSEPSKMDDVIYSLQDKHVDTRRVVQAIAKTGKEISDKSNPYLQEELFHGRAAKGVKDFLDFELRPLLAKMQLAKIDMGDFEEYLWNRHAEERNKQIAKINPEMKDGGSGIKTADARAFLAGIDANKRSVLESLAQMVDGMNRSSQRVLVESGLETQETIDAWNGAYKHYVPLQREDVDSGHVGTGKGFSIRGSSTKRAMGSGRAVVDIIANLTMQRERNIVRAEKNRVSNALLGLAVQNPNPDFWTVDQAPKERVVEEKAIYTVTDDAGNATEFTRMDDAEKFARSLPGADIEQTWGDRVTERIVPGFSSRDNVLLTRVNGKDHYITFNERDERAMRMVQSLKNLDADNMGRVLSIVGKATRYLASISTQYNPVFGVINLIRDAQGALINLSSTPLAGDQKRVFGYTLDALRGIYSDIRAHRKGDKPSSSWAKLFEEFQNEGGQTGYRDQYANAEQRAEAIRSELDQFKEGKVKQLTRGVFGWLSDYNETMENAVRLATYKAAKERGLSNQKAASLAKSITVNFNRKGQMATQVGALYAFFNASVQGSARLAETLFESKDGDIKTAKLSKAGKKIVMGGIMLGSMQALLLAAAGFGDDEPPEFIRERNLILPIGDGKYLTLAMPLGFHVIPGIGRIATEFVMGGGKDPIKHMAAFAGMFAESFNPIGSSGFSLQTITPSVVDPFAALAENRDFTGKEIYRKDFNALNPTPGHMRAKDVATFYSRWISEGLNFITGGTEFKPGLISWSPDSIDYLVAQAGGGVMREANKVLQTGGAAITGEDLPLYKIPLVGRFIGDTDGQSGQSAKFYDAIKKINMHEAEYKGLLKDGRRQEAMDYLAENPAVKLIMAGNRVESQVRKLRSMKRDMVEKDADPDQVRAIDERITATMKAFNERSATAF